MPGQVRRQPTPRPPPGEQRPPAIPHLTGRAQACWLWDFATAAAAFKDSPKWATVGKAMAAAAPSPPCRDGAQRRRAEQNEVERRPLWTYEHVDTLVIALWPLVKAYNWTYRDLLNVLRSINPRPPVLHSASGKGGSTINSAFHRYPCDREQDFAAYCRNVLGLRKTGKGKSAKNGQPAGFEIAQKLCAALQNP